MKVRFRGLASLAVLTLVATAGCARVPAQSGIAVAGTTRPQLVTVSAPRLATPTVDVTVGIVRSKRSDVDTPGISAMLRGQMAAANGKASAAAAALMSKHPMPAGRLATVTVRPGDRVKKGQIVAVFDDTLLRLGVANAKAAEQKSRAQAGVLSTLASDLRDMRSDARSQGDSQLAAHQEKLDAGLAGIDVQIVQLESAVKQLPALLEARAKAAAGLAQAQQGLAAAKAALAEAEKAAESPSPPPGIEQQIAQIKKQIAQIEQLIAQAEAGLAKIDDAIAAILKAQAALPKLLALRAQVAAAGQAGLAQGRAALSDALATLADNISQLDASSDVMRVAAGIPAAAVTASEASLDQATLRAPCDGVVVEAMHAGEVPMVGAPVVTIRPAGPTLVDTYLTADQLSGVRVGEPATVALDSLHAAIDGRVHDIAAAEGFAPSNYPTKIVHLSSVVRVTVSVPDELPAGVPADVVIGGR